MRTIQMFDIFEAEKKTGAAVNFVVYSKNWNFVRKLGYGLYFLEQFVHGQCANIGCDIQGL